LMKLREFYKPLHMAQPPGTLYKFYNYDKMLLQLYRTV